MSASEVCRHLGITYRNIEYWQRTGLIVPTVLGRGSGSRSRYSEGDVRDLYVLASLMRSLHQSVVRYHWERIRTLLADGASRVLAPLVVADGISVSLRGILDGLPRWPAL